MPDPQTYTVTFTTTLPTEILADLMVTAFEGGISYWCAWAELVRGTTIERPWYSDPKLYEQDFEIKLHDAEEPDTWTLTPDAIKRGLSLLDTETLLRITEENYDADDADTFIQKCLFGEVVYG